VATSVVFTPNPGGLFALLKAPGGDVGRYMIGLGVAVAGVARGLAPRVTGNLQGSIGSSQFISPGGPGAEVVATASYAIFVHEGTGPHPIEGNPILRFPSKAGVIVYTPRVDHPGTTGQPFLVDAARQVIMGL